MGFRVNKWKSLVHLVQKRKSMINIRKIVVLSLLQFLAQYIYRNTLVGLKRIKKI